MAESEQYFTRDEAAAYLRVTRRFIDERIAQHDIPVVRMGYRTIRLRRSDLDAWMAERVESA
jgi:excisionase family DNA binding protein